MRDYQRPMNGGHRGSRWYFSTVLHIFPDEDPCPFDYIYLYIHICMYMAQRPFWPLLWVLGKSNQVLFSTNRGILQCIDPEIL